MISTAQKTLLHVAKSKLQLDREMYEAILQEQAGVRSSTDLDIAGFERVLRRFNELGFKTFSKTRRMTHRPHDPISAPQQRKIKKLYQVLGWNDLARQMGFNKRQCGKSWPQTRLDANKVIEGLKVIIDRE